MKSSTFVVVLCAIVPMASAGRAANGSLIAYDTAGDSAYNSGQAVGVSGGYGWGTPWTGDGLFVDSSSLGFTFAPPPGTSNVNSPPTAAGRAFVLPASPQFTEQSFARRDFSGALSPGQTFSVDFDTALITRQNTGTYYVVVGGPSIGVGAAPTFSPDYWIGTYDSNNRVLQNAFDTGLPLTDQGVHMEFAVLSSSQVSVSLTSLAVGGQSVSIPISSSTPAAFSAMYNDSDGVKGAESSLYFNNISITPEPTGACIAVAGVFFVALNRPRRIARRGAGSSL